MFKNLKLGTKIISLLIVLVILSVVSNRIISTNSQVSIINDNLTYTTKELVNRIESRNRWIYSWNILLYWRG